MSKNSLGVYISSRHVDITEVTGSVSAPRVLNFVRIDIHQVQTLPDIDKDKVDLARQEAVSVAIKDGLDTLGMKERGAYTILGTADVMIRNFVMPNLPRQEQGQAIALRRANTYPLNSTR